ncbi:MAG: hypothetical protein IE916_02400 [Epsilonproteobacteria bacterium]|nr:hypothetical protein [Campylobacterota bacterium]
MKVLLFMAYNSHAVPPWHVKFLNSARHGYNSSHKGTTMKRALKLLSQSYFFSQPHQPFFLFGIFWAILSMLLFALAYKGVITFALTPALLHLYTLGHL